MSALQTKPLPPRAGAVTPNVPASPQVKIERQYRKFLANRYMSFIWRSGLWTSTVLSSGVILTKGSVSDIPLAVLGTIPVFIALALLLTARRSYIIRPYRPTPRPSLIQLFLSSFWNERAIVLLSHYALFSLTVSNVWCGLLGGNDVALFTATKRHPWHLNERRVVLCGSNLVLFLILGARDILEDRLKPVWPLKKATLGSAVQAALVNGLSSIGLAFTLAWSVLAPFAYRLGLRGLVWSWVNWRMWAVFLRPFIGGFARASNRVPSAWSLVPQMLFLNFVALLILQLPVKALSAYVTQPLRFEDFYRNSPLSPEKYLVVALKSQDRYYLQFTLMELLRVVHVPLRRKAIFDDIAKSSNLTLELWQELLLQLGRVNYTLITRGTPGTAKAAPPTLAASAVGPDPRAIPVRQADIFRPTLKNKSSSFGLKGVLDGPIRATPPSPVAKLGQASALAVKSLEGVQGEVVKRIEAAPAGRVLVGEAQVARKGVNEWGGKEWGRRSVRAVLGDVLIAQRVIEIMVTLAVASVEEDTYGNVQQVLPASLEAIVRFRGAILVLQSQLVAQSTLLGRLQEAAADQVRGDVAEAVSFCDNAIRRVADAFGSSLGAFKFPPQVAHTLGEICKA
ncbi:hypothetical protein IAT38_002686 [Cryptococcus sp. DSM 104549]